jgi:hypothetical protein
MKGSSNTTISKDMADIYGSMDDNTKDSGRTTKWTEKVLLFGQTDGSTSETT